MAASHRRTGPRRASGDRGASLIIVLVIMMLSGLTVAALMVYAQTNLRTAKVYKDRTTQVQSASDAVDLAVAEIRYTRARGTKGDETDVIYGTGTAHCEGDEGSGEAVAGGFADREVHCTGSDTVDGSEKELIHVHVRFIDLNGDQPGAQVQILERTIEP